MSTVLILGASGRFGRHSAEAFWNAGWTVRLFDRSRDDLAKSAEGADVIVNGWHPAYTNWAQDVPALTARVIAAARSSGATVIVPGNVYVFGTDAPATLDADTPHRATNPLGRVRIQMEASYRRAGIRVINLRCGDFLDTEASGNWFDKVMAPTLNKGVLTCPGALDADHAWAYLPDVAQAVVQLAERRAALPAYADIPFAGYTLSAQDMAALASKALGRCVTARPMAWLPLHIARPFWRMAGPLLEMRYLWSMPHRLDGAKLNAVLPDFRPTDPEKALATAIGAVLPTDDVALQAA